MNVVEAGGRRERRLQVGAMDTDVRRSETLTVRRPHLVPANEAAGAPVPVDQRGDVGPVRGQLRSQAELLEETRGVGRQRDRGPDLPELSGLLVDVHPDAVSAQRDRQREAANAGADDGDPARVRPHIRGGLSHARLTLRRASDTYTRGNPAA